MANKTTVKDLDIKVTDLQNYFQGELSKFRKEIDKVKTPEALSEGEESNAELLKRNFSLFEATVKNELKRIQVQLNELKKSFEKVELKLDNAVQQQHKNSLLIHGIKEIADEDLYVNIKKVIENKLNIEVSRGDINYCYRYGKKTDRINEKPRPLLVHFVNRWQRDEIFRNKKLFKGSKIICTEYLSPDRYKLFKTVRDRFGKKNCWTRDCKIGFVCLGTVRYVTAADQLTDINRQLGSQ